MAPRVKTGYYEATTSDYDQYGIADAGDLLASGAMSIEDFPDDTDAWQARQDYKDWCVDQREKEKITPSPPYQWPVMDHSEVVF